jgi:hypothetical protein
VEKRRGFFVINCLLLNLLQLKDRILLANEGLISQQFFRTGGQSVMMVDLEAVFDWKRSRFFALVAVTMKFNDIQVGRVLVE